MAKMRVLAPVAFLALTAGQAEAAQLAYVTNYVQQLMRIDVQSSATILIGNLGFAAQGLAQTSSGKLYATNTSGGLFDVTGGVVTPIAPLGALSVGGMDSSGSTLWGYDNTSKRLFEYDPIATSFVQWSPVLNIPSVEAIAIDPAGDFLFTSKVSSLVDRFGKITNGTWGVTVINPNMGLADNCEAMDFLPDGKLYAAVLGDTRYELNPLTGTAVSGFFSGVHRDWADMAAPVSASTPEPATLLAVAGGLGALLRSRRRR